MRFAYKAGVPAGFWMVLIFVMSTGLGSSDHTSLVIEPIIRWLAPEISEPALQRAHFFVRKCAHFCEYAVLAMLLLRALRFSPARQVPRNYWHAAGGALLITALYASTDEWHQSFVPGRTSSVIDVLIDTSGGLTALAFATLWIKALRPARQEGVIR